MVDNMTLFYSYTMDSDGLRVTASNPDHAELMTFLSGADLLEALGLLGNGWGNLSPDDVGALTDCPWIITNDVAYEDDGTATVWGRIWWFPDYMVVDPMRVLAETGSVTFTEA